ncbi:metallopeptidase TldD-related protein [Novosphingobium sp.]|uniref:TldD/PmbA family protein n=1 Tax=Novosphingobium sp. TaxID=1874826 RepID=UPI0028A8C1E5|nr:metallopeptidase TldD-related protein [Novosphingobium sp.]
MTAPDAPPTCAAPASYLLHDEIALADIARDALDHARSLGADDAMAVVAENGGMTTRASNGRIESAYRDGNHSLAITVYDRQRTGRASTQALDRAAVRRTVEQAVAIAREVQPDEDAGLADPDWISRAPPRVPLFAPSGLGAEDLSRDARAIEGAVMAAAGEDRVRVVDAGVSSHDNRWARAASNGFCDVGSASIHHRWCVTIAEREQAMVRDYWSTSGRRTSDLLAPEAVGAEALKRSVARLGGREMGTSKVPVILDARIASGLLGEFCGALSGASQYQGQTFLPAPLEKQAMAAHLTLSENPFEPFGLGSAGCDSEGVTAKVRNVVEAGIVKGMFLGALAARKLGLRSTGNADGPTNLTLKSALTTADRDLPSLWRQMDRGLWITEFIGGGVNPVTGAYSKAASGFWIEGGEPRYPVIDFTVASDLTRMLRGIVAVGADVHREGRFRTGSILIDEMQVAGR